MRRAIGLVLAVLSVAWLHSALSANNRPQSAIDNEGCDPPTMITYEELMQASRN